MLTISALAPSRHAAVRSTLGSFALPARAGVVEKYPALRLQAALHVAGILTGNDMLELCRNAQVLPADVAQLLRGRLRWRDSQLARLEQMLDVPEGYINGRVGFSGQPLDDPDVLDLPPWMVLDGEDLRFDSCVLTNPLAHLSAAERTACISAWMGDLPENHLADVMRGKMIPSRRQLQQVKHFMLHEQGLKPDQALPFVQALAPPVKTGVPVQPRFKSGTRSNRGRIPPGVLEGIEAGIFPTAWKEPLARLQQLADAGKLKLNRSGNFSRDPFVARVRLLVEQGPWETRAMFCRQVLEGYPHLGVEVSALRVILSPGERDSAVPPQVAMRLAEVLQVSVFSLLGVDET